MASLNPLLSEAGFSTSPSGSEARGTQEGLNPLLSEAGFSTNPVMRAWAMFVASLNPLLSEAGFSTKKRSKSGLRAGAVLILF